MYNAGVSSLKLKSRFCCTWQHLAAITSFLHQCGKFTVSIGTDLLINSTCELDVCTGVGTMGLCTKAC